MEEIKKENMTPEQLDVVEQLEEIFNDKAKRDKLLSLKDTDETLAFFAENGIKISEEQKQAIREKSEELLKKASEMGSSELTEEELEAVAGGWSWGWAIMTGLVGAGAVFCAMAAFPALPACTCLLAGIGVGGIGGFIDNLVN